MHVLVQMLLLVFGETNSDFLETYNFLKSLNISYLHVFSFSGRIDTKAYNMLNKVGLPEKYSRSKMLRILSTKKTRKFYTENKDFIHSVLFESENKNGFYLWLHIKLYSSKNLLGSNIIKQNH